jgi:hypothetical protein
MQLLRREGAGGEKFEKGREKYIGRGSERRER